MQIEITAYYFNLFRVNTILKRITTGKSEVNISRNNMYRREIMHNVVIVVESKTNRTVTVESEFALFLGMSAL